MPSAFDLLRILSSASSRSSSVSKCGSELSHEITTSYRPAIFSKRRKSATPNETDAPKRAASNSARAIAFGLKSVARTSYPLSANPIAWVPIPHEQLKLPRFDGHGNLKKKE